MSLPKTPHALLFLVACSALSACAEPSKDPPSAPAAPPIGATSAASASASAAPASPTPTRQSDVIATSAGDLRVTPVHHGTLLLSLGDARVWVDPWTEGDLSGLPKASLILLTDMHADHFDPKGIEAVSDASTIVVAPQVVADKLPQARVIKNGEKLTVAGLSIEAVPMYNLVRGPKEGALFHDKGRGNGYVVAFGDKRVYLSGDTECTPEMKALSGIDVAFVCMNLPYTMPPDEAATCIQAFRPKIVYPYHYRGSDLSVLTRALAGQEGIEVREREWY